jgi:hypothetical protein
MKELLNLIGIKLNNEDIEIMNNGKASHDYAHPKT